MNILSDVTIGDLYHIDSTRYENIGIDRTDLSRRVRNVLYRYGIKSLGDLLAISPKNLYAFRNWGDKCQREIENFFENFEMEVDTRKIINTDDLQKIREAIKTGNIDSLIKNDTYNSVLIEKIYQANADTDYDLIMKAISGDENVFILIDTLKHFSRLYAGKQFKNNILKELPINRLKADVKVLYKIFMAEKRMEPELSIDEDFSLRLFIDRSVSDCSFDEPVKKAFFNWCKFDLLQFLDKYIETKSNIRSLNVIKLRSDGHTLEEVGNILGVTRERVRQIERKENDKLLLWMTNNFVMEKVQVDYGIDDFLPEQYLIEYFNGYGKIINYVCKSSDSKYIYDKGYRGYIIDERKVSIIEKYVDSLSETINEKELADIINFSEKEYSDKNKFVIKVIRSKYRKTGETYHKYRLTLSKMYADILIKYYPDGIHVSDKYAIDSFKQYVFKEFGVKVDSTYRAVASIIARIGILCNRGQYKYNSKDFISNELADEIYEYIINSDIPAFLTNTIFEEFEEKLLNENITNKYFLQGILHDKFEDKLFFRRDYISKDNSFISLYTQINNYIEAHEIPVDKKDIFDKFPGVTEIVVNLATSDENIINLFGKYIYGNQLKLIPSEVQYLRQVTNAILDEKGTTHCKEIYNYILRDNPILLTNNYITRSFCLFSILEYLFREELSFDRPYIALQNTKIEKSIDTLMEMIRETDEIKISHILAAARESHYTIQSSLEFVNSCNDTHLLIDSESIASIEMIGINERIAEDIERMIDSENIKETMPIGSLRCIHNLPRVNEKWNDWMLYSVINKWSKNYVVAPSNSQLRMAIPLIAPVGKMDITPFENFEKGEFIHADDLNNIDELIEDIIIEDIEGISTDEL